MNNLLNLPRRSVGCDGPEVSPYSSPTVVVVCANDSKNLTVHGQLLLRNPKLSSLQKPKATTVDLSSFSYIACHALVHYLYTDHLQILDWSERSDSLFDGKLAGFRSKLDIYRLARTLEIYRLARTVELSGLEELARDEIERCADELDVFSIIDAVKEAYPDPIGDDAWFPQWIKSQIKKAFRDPSTLSAATIAPVFSDESSVVKLLLGCMLETYGDMVESLGCPGTDEEHNGKEEVAAEPEPERELPVRAHSEFQSQPEPVPEPKPEPAPPSSPTPPVTVRRIHKQKQGEAAAQAGPEPAAESAQELEIRPPMKAESDLVPTPKCGPAPEPEPERKPKPAVNWWRYRDPAPAPAPTSKNTEGCKVEAKKIKRKTAVETPPESEPEPEPEIYDEMSGPQAASPTPEPVCEPEMECVEPEPDPEQPLSPLFKDSPLFDDSPLFEDEVERDPWEFWGVKKSPTARKSSGESFASSDRVSVGYNRGS